MAYLQVTYQLNIAIFHSYANLLKAILPRLHAGRFPAWFREGGEVGFGLVPEGSGAGSKLVPGSSGAGLCGEVGTLLCGLRACIY